MTRTVTINCDNCNSPLMEANPSSCISDVEVILGGKGAATSKFYRSDLCRACYNDLYNKIKKIMGASR